MHAENHLLTVQRRFLAAIREPLFGDSRGRSELLAREGAVSEDFVDTAHTLITPSFMLTAEERLELYHRQYWYRLLDSIAEDFPALRRFLGEDTFWRLIEAYLEAMPPSSFTLRHLGARLADFTAAHPKLSHAPIHAAELARLEYALCESFEAGEHSPASVDDFAGGVVALQPHVKLLALSTPSDTIWRRAESGRPLPVLAPPSSAPNRYVAVYRHDFLLKVERLSKAAFVILSGIAKMGHLSSAMEKATAEPGLLRSRDISRIEKWFETWTARGWFVVADDCAQNEIIRINERK